MKKDRMHRLLTLFLSNLYISACTFGGGFVIVSFMRRRYVEELHWITEEEMLDMTALAQSAPGPIAVNAAIQVGWKVGGLAGMLASVLGTCVPPVVILSVISLFYRRFAENRYVALVLRGMQCGVAAVILSVTADLVKNVARRRRIIDAIVALAAFAAVFWLRINVVFIILAAAAVGIAAALAEKRRGGRTA